MGLPGEGGMHAHTFPSPLSRIESVDVAVEEGRHSFEEVRHSFEEVRHSFEENERLKSIRILDWVRGDLNPTPGPLLPPAAGPLPTSPLGPSPSSAPPTLLDKR